MLSYFASGLRVLSDAISSHGIRVKTVKKIKQMITWSHFRCGSRFYASFIPAEITCRKLEPEFIHCINFSISPSSHLDLYFTLNYMRAESKASWYHLSMGWEKERLFYVQKGRGWRHDLPLFRRKRPAVSFIFIKSDFMLCIIQHSSHPSLQRLRTWIDLSRFRRMRRHQWTSHYTLLSFRLRRKNCFPFYSILHPHFKHESKFRWSCLFI